MKQPFLDNPQFIAVAPQRHFWTQDSWFGKKTISVPVNPASVARVARKPAVKGQSRALNAWEDEGGTTAAIPAGEKTPQY